MLNLFSRFFRRSTSPPEDPTAPAYGGRLTLWIIVVVFSNTMLWVSGVRRQQLLDAVEQGTAQVEAWALDEDLEDAQIRESIQTQRDTLPFWTTLAMLADFGVEPMWLALRVLVTTVTFSSLAAIVGRPTEFGRAMAANATLQGFWALGFLVRTLLSMSVEGGGDTSLALIAPAGEYRAPIWLALQQLDAYALLGWIAIGVTAWRRRQANWFVAAVTVVVLAGAEASIRSTVILLIGASMRLTIVPS